MKLRFQRIDTTGREKLPEFSKQVEVLTWIISVNYPQYVCTGIPCNTGEEATLNLCIVFVKFYYLNILCIFFIFMIWRWRISNLIPGIICPNTEVATFLSGHSNEDKKVRWPIEETRKDEENRSAEFSSAKQNKKIFDENVITQAMEGFGCIILTARV